MVVYELKLADGRVVTWQGKDGVDAAVRADFPLVP